MRVGRSSLYMLLQTNVTELRFRRRIDKPGFKDYRRMLCTNDQRLLQSIQGKKVLNFVPSTGQLKYNPAAKNLIVAWDIFLQNYRMINCNDVELIAVIKSSPDPTDFWKYFNERLAAMTATQKAQFINT